MNTQPLVVTVTLNSCKDCRHADHSGAFTPGGAVKICGHMCAAEIIGRGHMDPYHWKYRKTPSEGIPDWCPLRYGDRY